MNSKVSVVIITQNRALHLQRCLNSLAHQTRLPDEVIVLDNCSTDTTQVVAHSFLTQLPVRYIYSDHSGYSYNRNLAIKSSKYNIIAWTDDDCEVFPDWIEEVHKCCQLGMYLFQGVDTDSKTNAYSYAQNLRTDECRYYFNQLITHSITFNAKLNLQIYGQNQPLTLKTTTSVDHRCFVYQKPILQDLPFLFDDSLPSYFSADEWDIYRRIRNAGHQVLLNPRLRVIHHGRSNFKQFVSRQIYYGRNDAIRYWLDTDRRRKLKQLKPFLTHTSVAKFVHPHLIWLKANLFILHQVLTDEISLIIKLTAIPLYLLGKFIRLSGKFHEFITNPILRTSPKKTS